MQLLLCNCRHTHFLFPFKVQSIILAMITLTMIFRFAYLVKDYDTNFISLHLNHAIHHNKTILPRICCLILTTPVYFLTRVKAINETWAPRCDLYFFITDYNLDEMTPEEIKFAEQIPIAPIENIKVGYEHLTQKSNLAFLFAYENYLNDSEWFIKADDDTYLIVEHLKTFLSKQNSSEPITFGYTFQFHVRKGYHSGGASYVLSRESLRRFYEAHNDPAANCAKDGGAEDIEIARCLRKKGVYPGKALDKENRELFHPLPFHEHFHGVFPDWLLKRAANPLQSHYNCCSNQTISFHYVSPDEQYLMDFLLYRARV
ncbi:unnamed protein product [Rotaria sordida]|uniref:N-acetylgalactosaminide beta-1,3-galactosyltransferase n=1 Tax=Rotaria sordida TaxID=392033 RepID=A0A813ZEH2_9BILA|nr:unnamed protein product [Rotaria sordida]